MNWFYDRLTRHDKPQAADLIFVFAGRTDRHRYGLELYRAGIAPRLLLSIGRFEVSKMRSLGLEQVEEIVAERNRIPPEERHFFYEMSSNGIRWEKPCLRRWSTYGEVLGLGCYLAKDLPRRIVLVSTDLHLRRIAVTMEKVFRGAPMGVLYCPVPSGLSSVDKKSWWSRPKNRAYVLAETIKLIGYQLILRTPDGMVRRLMRLK